jgi:hypothetical protein
VYQDFRRHVTPITSY